MGNLILGGSADETYGRVVSLLTIIFKKNIIPIIIGGSQDLLYAVYRAYDSIQNTVNMSMLIQILIWVIPQNQSIILVI